MRKYLPVLFLVIIFQYFPAKVYAQIDVPKWVDDIGGPIQIVFHHLSAQINKIMFMYQVFLVERLILIHQPEFTI